MDLPYDLRVAFGNENFCNHFEKTVSYYLLKLHIYIAYGLAIPLQVQLEIYTRMFVAVLFTILKPWK